MNLNNPILSEKLDFETFMRSLRYFPVDFIYSGGYTNDDYQMYIIDAGENLEVKDFYEAYDEIDGEIISNEAKARYLTIPMPKTVQQAIEAIPLIFNDLTWKEEDIEEILIDYKVEKHKKTSPFVMEFFKIRPHEKKN
jgi:hypothetical protein